MTLVILASRNDVPANVVHQKVSDAGAEAVFIDCEGLDDFAFSLTEVGEADLVVNGSAIGPVRCVWNRAKLNLELVATEEQRQEFCRRAEWAGAYRSIAAHFAGTVVNDPIAQFRCDQKTEQQKIAARLGLPVPPTLITNSRAKAIEFAALHGELICKSTGRPQLPYNQVIAGPNLMVTCAVRGRDIERFPEEEFAKAATLLQKRIPKKFEYRVSIVDGKVFAFRLQAPAVEHAQVDWRLFCDHVKHKLTALPDEVERALLGFLQAFGLWQGHFDLIQDPEDRFWFVECNPNGEWFWLDRFVDGALSDWYALALCRLSSGRPSDQKRS